jgi:hypothetical protein
MIKADDYRKAAEESLELAEVLAGKRRPSGCRERGQDPWIRSEE